MSSAYDAVIFADKIMFLLRTKYSEWKSKDLPFHAAFIELADKAGVPGDERYPLMQEIGKTLASRKKHKGAANARKEMPKINFVVGEKSRQEVILLSPMMGDSITLRRDQDGKAIWHACVGHHSQLALTQAMERADEIFAELDQEAIRASEIQITSKCDDKITMILGGRYKVLMMRGANKSVKTLVVLGEEEVAQKDVPAELLKQAKSIARVYFKDTRTGDLFGG